MNKRKEWKDYDIVRPEDAQRWEDKPDLEEIKTIVEETAGSGGSSEVVEEVKGDLDEHIKDKKNPHSVTAEQVGAYTKEETDGRIGNLDDLETESKENLVSAVNELKNDTAEIADTSVKTISIGKGLDRIVHYPDQNGDINFSDDFYVPNRGKVIAEGDMPTTDGIPQNYTGGSVYSYIVSDDLTFVINEEDLNVNKGIAVDYELKWYPGKANGHYTWEEANKNIIPVNKLSSIPETDYSSVYFKVTEATILNTMLFSKETIQTELSNTYYAETIYGQFLRRYSTGVTVDETLKNYFQSGISNCDSPSYGDYSQQLNYQNKTILDIKDNKCYHFYPPHQPQSSPKFVSCNGNSISMLANVNDNILRVRPVPLIYWGEHIGSGYIGVDARLATLTVIMVPTKIYYYN